MDTVNALAMGKALSETVARVREQLVTTGQIDLGDFQCLFGDPMESVSFGDLHKKVEIDADAARRMLLVHGIILPVSYTTPTDFGLTC